VSEDISKVYFDVLKERLNNQKAGFEEVIRKHQSIRENSDNVIVAIIDYFDKIVERIDFLKNNNNGISKNLDYLIEQTVNNLNDLIFKYSFHSNNGSIFITNVLTEQSRLYRTIESEITRIEQEENFEKTLSTLKKVESNNNVLENIIEEANLVKDDLKNKKVHEIFEDDSKKFKTLARRYEFSFYLALAFLFLYFFGWYIEIDTANFKFKFAEQFHGNHTPTFYVQKISLLILSTTLAAFLLKRSFMNRRLADDAYRTAKELDALPRYMEGMPDEMKEKIRFDLAYKYFGNGIHNESYAGGENLMHENIKANTDFIKAVKDLTPKAEASKEEKTPKDAA
jgi:hypothetical protein